MVLLVNEDNILIRALRLEKGWKMLQSGLLSVGALQRMVVCQKITDTDHQKEMLRAAYPGHDEHSDCSVSAE